jgi:DNA-binding SARP family transcriptional activator/TolB-like protein
VFRLTTLGSLTLSVDGTDKPQPRRRLALLARLAPSGTVGVSRAELLAELWPERDTETARHNLDQLLYELRRSLDASPVIGSTSLRLDPSVISVDMLEFTSALDRGDIAGAVRLYAGAFLQGFSISGAIEFERWVDNTRDRLAAQHRRALEQLAGNASAAGAHDEAVRLWRKLAADDRFGSRVALGLMRALADAGDSVGALEHARLYARVVQSELEAPPDPAVVAFAENLRLGSPRQASGAHHHDATAHSEEPPVAATDIARPGVIRARRHLLLFAVLPVILAGIAYGAVRWSGGYVTTRDARVPGSIAVLPMIDETVGRPDDGFADGMTESLIRALANTRLKVTARTSTIALNGSHLGARAIADTLHVSNILESTMQRDGTRLRVTVRLVDGSTELARWQETYDREIGAIFDVQDDIVHSVARELHVQLVPNVRRPTNNLAAYELYLRARDPLLFRTDSAIHFAIGLLDQAIALDTGFAAAYAAQAEFYANAVWGGDVGPDGRREMYRRALDAARHAIALDDSLPEAHMGLGVVSLYGYQFRDAELELERARSLDPALQGLSGWIAELYRWTGRPDKSLVEVRRELESDPLSATATAGLAHSLFFARRYDEATTEINKVLSLSPPMRRALHYRAQIFLAQHQWDKAIASLRPTAQQPSEDPGVPRLRVRSCWTARGRSGVVVPVTSRCPHRTGQRVRCCAGFTPAWANWIVRSNGSISRSTNTRRSLHSWVPRSTTLGPMRVLPEFGHG